MQYIARLVLVMGVALAATLTAGTSAQAEEDFECYVIIVYLPGEPPRSVTICPPPPPIEV